MKKFIVALALVGVVSFAAELTGVYEECSERLENEIIELLYSGKAKNLSKEEVRKSVKESFKMHCEEAEKKGKQVVKVQKTSDIKDCVLGIEEEILRVISESPDGTVQEIDLKVLIENVNKNFEGCRQK